MRTLEKSKRFAESFEFFIKRDPKIASKIVNLLKDVLRHPTSGIGKPERLKHKSIPTYSRRINDKDRLVYEYDETSEIVRLLSCRGHYKDK